METVIFDCDGVLVDSEAIAEKTLIQRLGEWLPDVQPASALRQALGMTTAAILEHIERDSIYTLPTDALERIDTDIEARLARELLAIEGVAEVVARLDMPLAIVSNSRRQRVVASLKATGLDAWLGNVPVFTGDQAERPKPDPAVYLLAARSMGCDPTECLVIEDSVSGVKAAHAAGMTVVGFTGASHIEAGHEQHLLKAGAWQIMSNMQGLEALIEHWRHERKRSLA